jgi:hypothetical protein
MAAVLQLLCRSCWAPAHVVGPQPMSQIRSIADLAPGLITAALAEHRLR